MMKRSRVIEEDLAAIAEDLRDSYPRLSGKTILVAGGAGFLGRYLVSTLDYLNENNLERPCRIIVVDNFVSGLKDWIPPKPEIRVVQHDVKEPLHIEEPVDYIINAASIASPVFYNRLRLETIDAGVYGTRNLLELARQKSVESFLFLSSSEVYGDPDPRCIPTSEEYLGNVSCIGPRACYDEPKRLGETLCMNYAEIYNLPIKIARPFNIFGPGIRLDDGRVVPTFVVSAITGKRIPVHGDGKKTRTFCYISDATVGFFKLLLSDRNREVFNIGADDPEIQIRHVAALIHGLVMNHEGEIELVSGPADVYTKDNPERRCPDLSKIRTQLGYAPKVDLVSGLKRFIAWVREELTAQYHSARFENRCRVCGGGDLRKFLSLGASPLANSLLNGDALEKDVESYPLEVVYCPSCHNCQLSCTVERDRLFKHYPYLSSTTETFRKHFAGMAKSIVEMCDLAPGSLVVDIGSNDGVLLKSFQSLGMAVLGVEPAENIARIARESGIDTIADYFDGSVVDAILKLKGPPAVITANNVFAHTDRIDGFVHEVKRLLSKGGVFVLEVQYLLDTLKNLTFDNIYHEHLSYFCVLSLSELFRRRGMEVFDVMHVDTHGGSLRVFVQEKGGAFEVKSAVERFLAEERAFGLDRFQTYESFAQKIHELKSRVLASVREIKARGESLVGYGAPAKATTLLNFCGLGSADLDFVVDDNPLKQGRFIPGVKVPIKGSDALAAAPPDNVLILAWNFADEIIKNNERLRKRGTRFLVPLPQPRIV
jgi:nucleoside-diphosphate-sugar epimerase/2-polyprenyl-3-methyl-5-hydroxy-6-metoxy-1,4-benzoquinol methylase